MDVFLWSADDKKIWKKKIMKNFPTHNIDSILNSLLAGKFFIIFGRLLIFSTNYSLEAPQQMFSARNKEIITYFFVNWKKNYHMMSRLGVIHLTPCNKIDKPKPLVVYRFSHEI